MMNIFTNYWEKLDPREQLLIKIAIPLSTLMLLYLVLWIPFKHWQTSSSKQSHQYQQLQKKLENAQNILVPVQKLTIQQWQNLAENHDLEDIKISLKNNIFSLQAEARNIESAREFMSVVAEHGGYWQLLKIEKSPIKIKIEWINI